MIFNEILRLIIICGLLVISMCYDNDDSCKCDPHVVKDIFSTTRRPCGQYGIRCLDKRVYEMCPIPDADDGSTEKPAIRECREGFYCDEDNPAFCTPIDTQTATTKTETDPCFADIPDDYQDLDSYYYFDGDSVETQIQPSSNQNIQLREERNCCKDVTTHSCLPTTTDPPLTSTTSNYYTTINFKDKELPLYDCETLGFFPDELNNTFFWYCDVPENGEGFLVRHMACGNDRVFDPYNRLCILKGTTRRIRTDSNCASRFSCQGKAAGKYGDDKDKKLYHLCLPSKYSPIRELLFACPDNMIFDDDCKKCKTLTIPKPLCQNKMFGSNDFESYPQKDITECPDKSNSFDLRPPPKQKPINCPEPLRLRNLNDCNGYFMCYQENVAYMSCPDSFKFDDNIHECLPSKIAHCQEISS